MSLRIVIPIKAPALCKTRLAPVLGDRARQEIVTQMLTRTVEAATGAVGPDQVFLLGPSRHGLRNDIPLLSDEGKGMNAVLTSARDDALRVGMARLLVLSADLPFITMEDVAALVASPAEAVAIAPDDAGQGTNALVLPLPEAANFRFLYGDGSLAAHREEAMRLGLSFVTVERPGLGRDIDTPGDLARWRLG